MCNKNVWVNGRQIWVSNLREEDGTWYARVQGVDMSEKLGREVTERDAAKTLAKKKLMKHGFCPVDVSERSVIAKHVNGVVVENTHVIKNADGSAVAVGIINGNTVSVYYSGILVSRFGETSGKPWLRKVREDLVAEYRKTEMEPAVGIAQVDDAFLRRLAGAENLHISVDGKKVSVEGTVTVDLSACTTQVSAVKAILKAKEKVDKIRAEEAQFVEEFFRAIGA